MQAVSLERFYLTRETVNNNYNVAQNSYKKKQKKTIELVHYSTCVFYYLFHGLTLQVPVVTKIKFLQTISIH